MCRVRTLCGCIGLAALLSCVAARSQISPAETRPVAAPEVEHSREVQNVPGLKRRDEQILTLQTTSRMVMVDVAVTDAKGRSVKGLTAGDFNLLEDGTAQTLAHVEEHVRISAADAAREAARTKLPPNTFSNYGKELGGSIVFLIDALDNQVATQMQLRQEMLAYLKTVSPGTRIAIFELDNEMHMIQGFTTDRDALVAAVSGKRDQPKFSPWEGAPPPLPSGWGSLPGERAGGGVEMGNVKRRVRSQVLQQGMQALGAYLSAFPGRKSLVWFTGDIPVAGDGPGVGGQFADQRSFIDDLTTTTDVLQLNQIAVYPVDARGLSTVTGREQLLQHGALSDIADATGGTAFYNTNGLKQVMEQVEDTTSSYYTLAYTPTNRTFDGNYRTIELSLAQQGMRLAYRRGYFARNDDYELAAHAEARKARRGPVTVVSSSAVPASSIDAAMPLGAPMSKDILFFAQVKPQDKVQKATSQRPLAKDDFLDAKYRKGTFREYQVHFAVRMDTLALVPTANGSYRGRLEFVAVVYDDQGKGINSKILRTSVNLTGTTFAAIAKGGLEILETIAVPAKGNFFLRVGMHDVTSDKSGAIEVPVGEIRVEPGLTLASAPVQPAPTH